MIENRDKLIHIHNNAVNNIAECNLLHGIINPHKLVKNINSHYSPILHGCMNARKGRAKFKNFRIILYSRCSSTILMRRLVQKLCPEKYSVIQWQTQARNVTTDLKVNVYFTLTALSATNVVTWKCHVDDSAKGRYDMILARDILTELLLNLKYSKHVIEEYDGPFMGATAPMIGLGAYLFKDLNTGIIKP